MYLHLNCYTFGLAVVSLSYWCLMQIYIYFYNYTFSNLNV